MFLGYIHSYRALAILFIVAGHAIDAFVWDQTNKQLETLLRIVISNGSVLFVFIAGYLFQHLSHKYKVDKYFKAKISNVIIPYVLISIPAIIVFVAFMQRENVWTGFYDQSALMQIISFYLTGLHLAPLWFIPFISLVYLLSPILIWGDRKKILYYTLPLFMLISCLYDRSDMPLDNLRHFFSVFLLGMYFSHYKVALNNIVSKNTILIFLGIAIIALTYLEMLPQYSELHYLNYLQKIIMSVFFLGVFISLGEKVNNQWISLTANLSFGTFFIHSYLLTGSKMVYSSIFGQLPHGNFIGYCLVAITILIISTAIILLIKKVTGNYSKYFVGS